MKIVCFTSAWHRRELLETMIKNCPYHVVACVSNTEDERCALDNGASVVWHRNDILSDKFQAALNGTKELDPDAVLIMGSDDVANKSYYKWAEKELETHDFVGVKDVYIKRGDIVKHWQGYAPANTRHGEPIGCGRFYRRDLLDKVDWVLWNKKSQRGIDGVSWARVNNIANAKVDVMGKNQLIDIKESDTQMTKFELFESSPTVEINTDWIK